MMCRTERKKHSIWIWKYILTKISNNNLAVYGLCAWNGIYGEIKNSLSSQAKINNMKSEKNNNTIVKHILDHIEEEKNETSVGFSHLMFALFCTKNVYLRHIKTYTFMCVNGYNAPYGPMQIL